MWKESYTEGPIAHDRRLPSGQPDAACAVSGRSLHTPVAARFLRPRAHFLGGDLFYFRRRVSTPSAPDGPRPSREGFLRLCFHGHLSRWRDFYDPDGMGRTACTVVLGVLICCATLLGGGCKGDYRRVATGADGEITVIIDGAQWQGPVGAAIREKLGASIRTLPAPEPAFDLRAADLEAGFETMREHKNVLIAAVLTDSSTEAQFIRARLPEDAEQAMGTENGMLVVRPDLWARSQMVVYAVAATSDVLARMIQQRGDELRAIFDEITRKRLAAEMFRTARQVAVEGGLLDRHGFAVNVQHDYFLAADTTGFVWLRRVMPDTWRSFFVHYVPGAPAGELTAEWIHTTRDSLTRVHLQGNLGGYVAIDTRRPMEMRTLTFLGHQAVELRGLWHMVGVHEDGTTYSAGMGGPFLTYAFYDPASDRTYLLDGMVFAPNFEKREFLRQMEAIAYTFRTQQSVAGSTVSMGDR